MIFPRLKNNFGQSYGIFDLDNFEVKLQYGVTLFPGFQAIKLKRCTDILSICARDFSQAKK